MLIHFLLFSQHNPLIPLGLGTFEAACTGMLHLLGVPLEAALTGAVLLRGLTFWLPMIPGLYVAQRALRVQGAAAVRGNQMTERSCPGAQFIDRVPRCTWRDGDVRVCGVRLAFRRKSLSCICVANSIVVCSGSPG
jgi:Lysylphosphatidylglycerol synthase TM region